MTGSSGRGGVAGAWRVVVALALLAACRGVDVAASDAALARYRYTHAAMGTSWSLVLYAPDAATADRAARAAFDAIDHVDALASDYDRSSELSRFERAQETRRFERAQETRRFERAHESSRLERTRNAEGVEPDALPVSRDFAALLAEARALAAATDGAFDPTVGAATRLWRRARRQEALPDPGAVRAALATIGWRDLHVDEDARTARLARPGAKLDLGGVAKGQALDRALDAARAAGVPRVLVEGGGDLRAGAPPPDADAWIVALEHTDERVPLVGAGLATSGDRYRGFAIDGVRYSHLLDPRTARPLASGHGATVIASTAAEADAFASAACVADPSTAGAWFTAETGRSARVDRPDAPTWTSPAWPSAETRLAGPGDRAPRGAHD